MSDISYVLSYLQADFITPDEEESYQAAEYERMFNSDESGDYDSYVSVTDTTFDDTLLQLKVNNRLLGMLLILVFVFMLIRFLGVVGGYVTNTIFKHL